MVGSVTLIAPEACPSNPLKYQGYAEKVAKALLGDARGIPSTSQCAALRTNIATLTKGIQSGAYPMSNVPNASGLWCGVSAFSLQVGGAPSTVSSLNVNADQCFGTGTGAFTFFTTGANSLAIVDPSPAQLTAPLSGSNGATAAAMDVGTGDPTTVAKWPTTFTGGTQPAAGLPCSRPTWPSAPKRPGSF